MNIPNTNIINNSSEIDEFYIHFRTSSLCEKFILNNNVEIGHRCCLGKGVLIKSINNEKITSYSQIKPIEIEYNKL